MYLFVFFQCVILSVFVSLSVCLFPLFVCFLCLSVCQSTSNLIDADVDLAEAKQVVCKYIVLY